MKIPGGKKNLIHTKSGRVGELTAIAVDGREEIFGVKMQDGGEEMRRPDSVRNADVVRNMYKVDYIFTAFDNDEDGVLNFTDFADLVKSANDSQELTEEAFSCTCRAVGSTAEAGLNLEQFARLYEQQVDELNKDFSATDRMFGFGEEEVAPKSSNKAYLGSSELQDEIASKDVLDPLLTEKFPESTPRAPGRIINNRTLSVIPLPGTIRGQRKNKANSKLNLMDKIDEDGGVE